MLKTSTKSCKVHIQLAEKINKENGNAEVDNDKFIAAYLELVKSYINNMTELMAAPSK